MTESFSVREARSHLAEVIDKAVAGEATVITRNGEPVAALIPIDEWEALEAASDELLTREAAKQVGEPTYSMAEVLADLFADDAPAA
ncbi:MAG: hypothetical protein QOF98_2230 [Streptomyces sp.]|jgi:prevent-host-death family protein|nr:hypothetical protein [Streptomyces sp.]